MSRNIVFYPMLDKNQLSVLDCRIEDLRAYYISNGEPVNLRCNVEEEAGIKYISIVDDLGKWSPDRFDYNFEGILKIHRPNTLFGEEGIISENGKLGIGLIWKSKTSNYRGSKKIMCLDSSVKEEMIIPFKASFDVASLRGTLEVSLQLFVISEGSVQGKLSTGVILGELDSMVMILEGINSIFTVFEKNAPGEPLWTVDCDWDDPEYDPFSECVRVTINTAHPAWQLTSDEEVRKELLKEIMASSMQVVIAELANEQFDGTNEYAPGSVCDAILYIMGRANLDMHSNASVAKSIREYLDKSIK